jgi:hypothetical protein
MGEVREQRGDLGTFVARKLRHFGDKKVCFDVQGSGGEAWAWNYHSLEPTTGARVAPGHGEVSARVRVPGGGSGVTCEGAADPHNTPFFKEG